MTASKKVHRSAVFIAHRIKIPDDRYLFRHILFCREGTEADIHRAWSIAHEDFPCGGRVYVYPHVDEGLSRVFLDYIRDFPDVPREKYVHIGQI